MVSSLVRICRQAEVAVSGFSDWEVTGTDGVGALSAFVYFIARRLWVYYLHDFKVP